MPLRPLPYPKTRFKRLPRGNAVTVCIAAICDDPDCIVCVSDMKLSKGHYSTDFGALKLRSIHKDWGVMISGTFGQKHTILEEVHDSLFATANASLSEVSDKFVIAYKNFNRRLAEESVLASYGLTLNEFVGKRSDLGDVIYERLWGDIARVKVGCDFLVFGFDNIGSHIFSVSNPTDENPSFISHADDPGFTATGSGGYIAESVLYSLEQNPGLGLNRIIYNVCAAKFSSEVASDVGDTTFMRVAQPGRQNIPIDHSLERELKAIWKENKPVVPPEAIEAIRNNIDRNKK